MRFIVGILFFLICHGANIQGPWDIDLTSNPQDNPHSCQPWAPKIQAAYNEIEEIVDQTLVELGLLGIPRPDMNDEDGYLIERWSLAERTLLTFFGISVSPDGNPGDWWQVVHDVFEPLQQTLKDNEVNHAQYLLRFLKPAIACGTDGWRYIAPGDIDPDDPYEKPLRDTPLARRKQYVNTGAWYWKNRYWWNAGISKAPDATNPRGEVGMCSGGGRGATVVQNDLITICPLGLAGSPTIDFEKVHDGALLDDISEGVLSFTLLHEFAHFFGARGDPSQARWPEGVRTVVDPQAVTSNGLLAYVPPDNPDGITIDAGTEEDPNQPIIAYNVPFIMWLANGNLETGNTGPAAATRAADAYAIYALASHLVQYDWSANGRAKFWTGSHRG
ncbi:hypothetical protein GGR57DRAFT_502295 [Xylariaceae sp. FL1272]|nr:hypothetical protein GGR57DRAFT_502295 [Xylariaceae sp. FL1272]